MCVCERDANVRKERMRFPNINKSLALLRGGMMGTGGATKTRLNSCLYVCVCV